MQVDAHGKIAIPQEIRDRPGLTAGTEIELEVIDELIQVRKKVTPSRGEQLIEHLRGKAPFKYTTDEIMQLTRGDD